MLLRPNSKSASPIPPCRPCGILALMMAFDHHPWDKKTITPKPRDELKVRKEGLLSQKPFADSMGLDQDDRQNNLPTRWREPATYGEPT